MRATNRKPIITYVVASTFWPHEDSEDDHRHRNGAWLLCGRCDCCCCCSFLGGLILSILFIMSIVISFVITLSTTMTDASSTTVSSASTDVTTATTVTATTATTRTTTTKTTTSTVTTITTTTTPFDSCGQLRWNQTGVTVAGTGTSGSAANQLKDPTCIEIDANDTMYICDHHNFRVQMYTKGASSGVTIVNAYSIDHFESMTFDKNRFLYLTGHNGERVLRYTPDFTSDTTVAGVLGASSTALNHLNSPLGMDLDDNLNLYIAERDNERVVKWVPNATSGTVVISAPKALYGIVLSLYSSNQAYVSSEEADAVYLWTFGAASPSVTLTQVNDTTNTLNAPRGLQYDKYGNLYVVDRLNKRVVMYCANSTIGREVVADNIVTNLQDPYDVAFDSDLNMYVVDNSDQKVIKYTRL